MPGGIGKAGLANDFRCALGAALVAAAGCGPNAPVVSPPVPPGGSGPPVTASRLQEHTLEHIRLPVTWRFDAAEFTLASANGPLPAQVAEPLLGPGVEAATIRGRWKLSADGSSLELTDIQAGDQTGVEKAVLAIGPAGPIRVNVGSEQYNLLKRQASGHDGCGDATAEPPR